MNAIFRALALILPVGLAFSLHLPTIDQPFGPGAVNGGNFFGVYARSFERHGFAELRGLPVFHTGLMPPHTGEAYLNHPPLAFWLASFGSDEASIRWPFCIAHALLVLLLAARILARTDDPWWALLAGLALAAAPVFLAWVDVGYESATACSGVLTLLLLARTSRAERCLPFLPWLLILGIVGIWCDWTYAFFAAGGIFMALGRGRLRQGLLALGATGLGIGLGVGLFILWVRYALAGPMAPPTEGLSRLWSRFDESVLEPPQLEAFARAVLDRLQEGHGVPFMAAGAIGLLLALRREGRFVLALTTAALLSVIVPARHAMGHIQFTAFFALPLAIGVGSLSALPGRLAWLGRLAAFCVIAWSAVHGVQDRVASGHPFFREVGRALDQAALRLNPDGSVCRIFRVHTNLPFVYAAYIEGPLAAPGLPSTAELHAARATPHPPYGLRLLVVEWEVDPDDAPFPRPNRRAIREAEALAVSSERLRHLEGLIVLPDGDLEIEVTRVRVLTIVP